MLLSLLILLVRLGQITNQLVTDLNPQPQSNWANTSVTTAPYVLIYMPQSILLN